jgi:hypothetical protein
LRINSGRPKIWNRIITKNNPNGRYKREGNMRMRFLSISPINHTPNVRKETISIKDTDQVSTFPYGRGEVSIITIPHVVKKGISFSLINRIYVYVALSYLF